MKMIDRAKAHYKRLADEPQEIRVPEWDDETGECIIYATPLTLAERVRLDKHSSNQPEMAVEMVILKAKDRDGNPLFTREDKIPLMRATDEKVIARIAQHIARADIQAMVEEAEKN